MGLLLLGVWVRPIHAQNTPTLQAGDPPIAALISIAPPDTNGIVTIAGAAGSVFPAAQVAVRNLYTGETVYTQAGITGSFSVSLYGPGNTPFWVSPAQTLPANLRESGQALPGGSGTIIYGAFPESRVVELVPITQILMDGNADDWQAYSQSATSADIGLLRNQNSLYINLPLPTDEYGVMQLQLQADTILYSLTLDPRRAEAALWQEVNTSTPRDLGALPVAAAVGDVIELRIPLEPLRARVFNNVLNDVSLLQVTLLDGDGNTVSSTPLEQALFPIVEERDGIVYPSARLENVGARFTLTGMVAGGASRWDARGRINQLSFAPGDTLTLELDVRMDAPNLPPSLVGLEMLGRLGVQPVTDAQGEAVTGGLLAGNGWSNVQTVSGFAIENLRTDFTLAEASVPSAQVVRLGNELQFGLRFEVEVPASLPNGVYVPYFEGFGRVGDAPPSAWVESGVWGTRLENVVPAQVRMPIVLRMGMPAETALRLPWTLFYDYPSDGARGVVAQEDAARVALSNRVKLNSPTYILPPSAAYPIEPYVPNMLPNAYRRYAPPLLPLLFPNGRLNATITLPDGSIDALSSGAIIQNVLSSPALDERTRFGEQSQVDMYRLTTLNRNFSAYPFTDYGEYSLVVDGFVEDVWGNRYQGGGTYRVLIAESLDLLPAVLSGTPFVVGDAAHLGLHISPNVAADVTVTVRVFPLDDSPMIETQFSGTANAYGVFTPAEHYRFETAGEYVIDYDVRFEDAQGRLWAGSLRSAGVVGTPEPTLILRGQRGMPNATRDFSPAWFLAETYSGLDSSAARVYLPYHSGDVLWLENSPTSGILLGFDVHDLSGAYADWLAQTQVADRLAGISTAISEHRLPLATFAAEPQQQPLIPMGETPIVNDAYSYVSIVSPSVSVRQAVLGGERGDLNLLWSPNDPLNEQIGAGTGGMAAGDFALIFGGAIVKNDAANVREAAIYGASVMMIDANDARGTRILPPYRGAASGADGGGLLPDLQGDAQMFFHPTSVRPGDVLTLGESFALAGQAVPTLTSTVSAALVAPSGEIYPISGATNPIGYFYAPEQAVTLNEAGVWQLQLTLMHDGVSSAGQAEPPFPSGSLLGRQSYLFYVVPANADKLAWAQDSVASIPSGFPYNFTFDIPTGWTDVRGYVSTTLPSRVVEEGNVAIQGTALRYQFNPTAINQRFPFYEGNDGRLSGAASSDALTLTFVLSGQDENGVFAVRARQVVIRHDRLFAVD